MPDSDVRFRALIEHGMDLIAIVGADGRFKYVSPAVTRLLGYDPGEAIGQLAFDYLHADDRARMEAAFVRALSSGATGTPQEFRLRHRNGEWRDFESVVTDLVAEPTVAGFVLNCRDVTDRREAERRLRESETRLRAAFMTVPDAQYIATRDEGRILEVNDHFRDVFGYDREEVLGRTSLELGLYANPDDRERMLRELRATGQVRNLEVLGKRKTGETFPAQLSVTDTRSGDPPLILGVVRDVSEQKRTGEALRRMEEQFRQAQRLEAVGRLAGGVAHDFNNILMAITGYAALLLLDVPADDPRRARVEEIRTATQRAAALTRQLLAFSRKQVLQPQVLDLNAAVRGLETMLRRLIGEDIELEFTAGAGLAAVQADPGQIEQVMLNLALNARDAMPRGGRLTIETTNADLDGTYAATHAGVAPGRYVLMAVSDTGIGMDQETQSHIFEPFFTTKELGKGTGLGLSTVHGIVSQSGGHIEVHSEPGRGATFRIFLPRVEASAESPGVAPGAAGGAGGHETVLVVEDDRAVREIVAAALAQRGYVVLQAPDAGTAMELARSAGGPIQVLLTDVVMPGMSGRELAQALAPKHPGLRVLYMSGYADDAAVRHEALEQDVPFLQKPFAPEELVDKVREVLDRKT